MDTERPEAFFKVEPTSSTAIYELIRRQVAARPNEPLDEDAFPEIAGSRDGITFAPGLSDVLGGRPAKSAGDWRKLRKLVRRINRGRISDWHQAEAVARTIPAAGQVRELFRNLDAADVTPRLTGIFWQMARGSADYEAVKWGIAVGGLQPLAAIIDDLLLLARHGELTYFAVHTVMRESADQPQIRRRLAELLPAARQWAVIRLIDFLVADGQLIADEEIQRQVLVYGMENNDGIPMEVAFTIASAIDLERWFTVAESEPRVFKAMVRLMRSLLLEPAPLGGLQELEHPEEVLDRYLELLSGHEADVWVLEALRSVEEFLVEETPAWASREDRLAAARFSRRERFSVAALRQGLGEWETRWMAIELAREGRVVELIPDLRRIFEDEPHCGAICALGEIGGEAEWDLLRRAIPKLVDRDARAKEPLSGVNVWGPVARHGIEYAEIVGYLGRLGTAAAAADLKTAVADFDPQVRLAALSAIAELPSGRLDEELVGLVEKRRNDPSERIRKSAEKVASRLSV